MEKTPTQKRQQGREISLSFAPSARVSQGPIAPSQAKAIGYWRIEPLPDLPDLPDTAILLSSSCFFFSLPLFFSTSLSVCWSSFFFVIFRDILLFFFGLHLVFLTSLLYSPLLTSSSSSPPPPPPVNSPPPRTMHHVCSWCFFTKERRDVCGREGKKGRGKGGTGECARHGQGGGWWWGGVGEGGEQGGGRTEGFVPSTVQGPC